MNGNGLIGCDLIRDLLPHGYHVEGIMADGPHAGAVVGHKVSNLGFYVPFSDGCWFDKFLDAKRELVKKVEMS
jgi:hypothetical protein